jgi:anti-sigma28 factor (negative regulator of flagellin synthesis)
MRVDDNSLSNQVSSTATRAAESQRIQVDTAPASGAGASASDRVDLSGLAARISQTMQALSGQSAQRAGQLQKAFRAGSYQPDTQRLASALAKA